MNLQILLLLLSFSIFSGNQSLAQCYSITNTSDVTNPSFTHTFTLAPAIGSSALTNMHTIRLRTSDTNAWKLTGLRSAISRTSGSGPVGENILDTDVGWSATITPVGPPTGTATLTAPFNGATTLNSISTGGGTVIVTGNNRSFTSCTNAMGLARYWTLDVTLSTPQDLIFNSGSYTGMITYTLSN
jgi:hypothetical protein